LDVHTEKPHDGAVFLRLQIDREKSAWTDVKNRFPCSYSREIMILC